MSDANDLTNGQLLQNLGDMVAHVLQGVGLDSRGAVGVAVAQQVGGHDTETLSLQRRNLVAPVVAGAWKAMQQEEGGLGCGSWRDVDEGIPGAVI